MDKNLTTCVDPEVELVPRNNSTTVQNVSNASVSGLFSQVCDGTMKLLEYLPSMSNAVEEVKEADRRVQSILVGITAASDPEVRFKLANLQQEFRDFIRVGKDFLENCLSMAKYVKNEQLVTKIKDQLGSKILDKLKMYIDSLSRYLKDCDDSFEEFRTTHKEMEDRVSCAKGHFSDQLKEAKETASDAVEKHEKAVAERTSCAGLTNTLVICSSAISTAGASGIIAPQVAVFESLFGYFLSWLARTNEGPAVLKVMEQERAREVMAKKEKILQDAINCVVSLYVSVLNAVSLIKDMKAHSNRASKAIEQRRGLQEFADSNKEEIDFNDLVNKLDKLQRAAGEIVKVIGEDGTAPISSKCDELVSNTQPLQTTDKGETTLQDAMKTQLSLYPKPNGNFSNPSQESGIAPSLEQAEQELVDPEQSEQEVNPEQAEMVAEF